MQQPLAAIATMTCLLGCGCAGTVAPTDAGLFHIHEIDTGIAKHQTVLAGSFTGPGQTELAVLDVAADGTRRVTAHRLTGGYWRVVREWPLARNVLFVDRVHVNGRDHVLAFRGGGFDRIDIDTGAQEKLAEVAANYRRPDRESGLPRLDVARDLNGDGRDDLVMPGIDGFWVSTQSADGSFAKAVKIGPGEPHLDAKAYGDLRSYGEAGINAQTLPWYLGRAHRLDYDRDGRVDLVFWNRDHFEVHRQNAAGGFNAAAETFTTDVPFDFDGAYALAFQFGDESVASLLLGLGGSFDFTVLHGFRDLNGDGIGDLVTLTFSGRRVFSLRGRYDVHFGRSTPDGIAFPGTADTTAWTPGPAGGQAWGYASQRFVDFDGDGVTDMAMAAVNTGAGGMVRAMVGRSITMDVALYRLRDGVYPMQPDARHRIRTPFAPFDKRGVLFPTVLVGDVNGDGRADLLAVERWDELSVYLGQAGPRPLAMRAVKVAVRSPRDDRFAQVRDLDGDGREDIVIHHPSAKELNRVSILMTRSNG